MTAGVHSRLTLGHLIVGPPGHGVVRAAGSLTGSDPVLRADCLEALDPAALRHLEVVVVHYTDRLFGPTVEAAADAFTRWAAGLGRPVVVWLHDLPLPGHEPTWLARRQAAYARVSGCAAGIVVSSQHEAGFPGSTPPLVVLPLPLDRLPEPLDRPATSPEVALLGWIYPGKGHAEVLAALPDDLTLAALGGVSPGHEPLLAELIGDAAGRLRVTGYLDDDELLTEMRAVAVPVAAHRRVSASASIGSWLEAGRRPLVVDGPWVRELESRCPGSLTIYREAELSEAIVATLENPASTWLGETPIGPGSAEVARQLHEFAIAVTR